MTGKHGDPLKDQITIGVNAPTVQIIRTILQNTISDNQICIVLNTTPCDLAMKGHPAKTCTPCAGIEYKRTERTVNNSARTTSPDEAEIRSIHLNNFHIGTRPDIDDISACGNIHCRLNPRVHAA